MPLFPRAHTIIVACAHVMMVRRQGSHLGEWTTSGRSFSEHDRAFFIDTRLFDLTIVIFAGDRSSILVGKE